MQHRYFRTGKVQNEADISELKNMIQKHEQYTGSGVARQILDNWSSELHRFVKVMPTDYKRVLEELATEEALTAEVSS